MGNISSCCKDSEDIPEEETCIINCGTSNSEANNYCDKYGSCSLPTVPSPIYRIILPIDIEPIHNQQLYQSQQHHHNHHQNNDNHHHHHHQPDHNNSSPASAKTTTPLVESSNDSTTPAEIKEEYCIEQFEHIRSLILQDPETLSNFKQLLWSCIPWSAPGGKSGSTFMKTVNDQFILKQMSKLELQSFLSISDQYFNYIEQSHADDKPSLLATILGIFRIVYTNTNQTSCEYYFMVMRNLFHKKNISQCFDLKGSMRNRLVETSDIDNTEHVLLDENLTRITCENPLFIHARSKKILNQAIDNDSKFLTSISVMDYSLLVGVDKENYELILGIIDYVRPFTWDKKIERVVKSVVSAELPTIVEPELYRERFCEAMDKYFESVPDHM